MPRPSTPRNILLPRTGVYDRETWYIIRDRAELTVRCPKCGAEPGDPCVSIRGNHAAMRSGLYRFHKKRTIALIVGGPSTPCAAFPVRGRAPATRLRVVPVDSAERPQS